MTANLLDDHEEKVATPADGAALDMVGQRSIYIIARSNDNFQKTVPFLEETLASLGYTVEVKLFSPGENGDDIRLWLTSHAESITGKELVVDYSVRNQIPNETINGFPRITNLDELLNDNAQRNFAIVGQDLHKKVCKIRNHWRNSDPQSEHIDRQFHIAVFQRMLATKVPPKIFIFPHMMEEHTFFRKSDNPAEAIERQTLVLNFLKECLIAAGMSPDDIGFLSFNDRCPPSDMPDGSWIIFDRHVPNEYALFSRYYRNRAYVYVQYPIINVIDSAIEHGLITISQDERNAAFFNMILEKFPSLKGEQEATYAQIEEIITI